MFFFQGQAFINGFNLGRYWPTMGPQVSLFVPAGVIYPSPAKNTLLMVELESAPCDKAQDCYVAFQDTPDISGKCFDTTDRKDVPVHHVDHVKFRGARGLSNEVV